MKRWNSRPDGMRLTSSMQPISISRSPPFGLRPVVSVSRMISRMPPLLNDSRKAVKPPSGGHRPRRCAPATAAMICVQRRLAGRDVEAGVHNEIGARPLFRIRHLPRQQLARAFPPSSPAAAAAARAARRAGALTTTVTSTSLSAPVSNSSGISSTASSVPRCACSRRKARSASRTSGCTIASSSAKRSGCASSAALSLARSTPPRVVVPGNARSTGSTASPPA